ncbi:SPAG5 isoform 13, partial [Pan troglodytes]
PHPETQDSSTQTDTSHSGITNKLQHLKESHEMGQALQQARNVMQSWVLVSKELISLLHLSLLHLEEDKTTVSQESQRAETLVCCCFDLLKKLRAKLQSLKAEREEARHREEMALRGKDAVGLHAKQEELVQQTVSLTSTLQQDWRSMQLDYTTWTALLSRSRQLTEKLTVKSQQALQERDVAIEEKQEVSRVLEQVSAQLEECKGQTEQLELENSRLATDLRAQLQILANMDSQLKEL